MEETAGSNPAHAFMPTPLASNHGSFPLEYLKQYITNKISKSKIQTLKGRERGLLLDPLVFSGARLRERERAIHQEYERNARFSQSWNGPIALIV